MLQILSTTLKSVRNVFISSLFNPLMTSVSSRHALPRLSGPPLAGWWQSKLWSIMRGGREMRLCLNAHYCAPFRRISHCKCKLFCVDTGTFVPRDMLSHEMGHGGSVGCVCVCVCVCVCALVLMNNYNSLLCCVGGAERWQGVGGMNCFDALNYCAILLVGVVMNYSLATYCTQ